MSKALHFYSGREVGRINQLFVTSSNSISNVVSAPSGAASTRQIARAPSSKIVYSVTRFLPSLIRFHQPPDSRHLETIAWI